MKKSQRRNISCLLFFSMLLLFVSCRQIGLYEQHTLIEYGKWKSDFPATGSFIINDTNSLYSLSIVLRHTDQYNYNNIWLNVGLQPPGDSIHFQKLNLTLGNDAAGWEGAAMNDIWEVRKMLNGKPQRFKKAGTYNYKLFQVMRDDPLLHIMSAGLRVEKIQ